MSGHDMAIDWTWCPKIDGFEVLQCDCVVEVQYRIEREDRRWSVYDWQITGIGIYYFDRDTNKAATKWLPMTDPFVQRMAADLEADPDLESKLIHDALEDMAA